MLIISKEIAKITKKLQLNIHSQSPTSLKLLDDQRRESFPCLAWPALLKDILIDEGNVF